MQYAAVLMTLLIAQTSGAFEWPWKRGSDAGQDADTSTAAVDRPAPAPVRQGTCQATFLDTINQGREIALAAADVTPIVSDRPEPAAAAPSPAPARQTQPTPDIAASLKAFRVQCLATTDVERARAQKDELDARTKWKVHIFSDPPYFKVQVGDFANRQSAERAKDQLTEMGYGEAWIVKPVDTKP